MVHLFYAPIVAGQSSATAHALVRQAYTQLTGKTAPEIRKEPGGRPYFASGQWQVSICHTKHTALCALADTRVGMDAEEPRSISPAMVRRCLSPAELTVYQQAADPTAVFLRFWTLKEAYGKYDGRGVIGYPHRYDFALEGDCARLSGRELWFRTLWTGQLTVSVCCATPQQVILHKETVDPL